MFYPFSFYGFDPTMFILIPAVILTIYAQSKVQNNFNKYLRVPTTWYISFISSCYITSRI